MTTPTHDQITEVFPDPMALSAIPRYVSELWARCTLRLTNSPLQVRCFWNDSYQQREQHALHIISLQSCSLWERCTPDLELCKPARSENHPFISVFSYASCTFYTSPRICGAYTDFRNLSCKERFRLQSDRLERPLAVVPHSKLPI